ncbi:MAG: hypothetical protein Q7T16_00525 [Candidatus Burarchaeum sp.]|nr:hypothetical protein [Candidatus Burarchaeum sp.]MDO8339123.1 hypothetical protein [Candidatus Burarchaeum sp.]
MKSALLTAFIFSILLLALAGCMGAQQQPAPKPPQGEAVIEPEVLNITVQLLRVPPEQIIEGGSFTVAWFVNSNTAKAVTQTELLYGNTSAADAYLPDERHYSSSTEAQTGSAPGAYEALIGAGTQDVYLRAFAVVEGKKYWSEEEKVTIELIPLNLSVRITNAPHEISSNVGFDIGWTVSSNKQKQVQTMELRYGMQSVPVPSASAYPNSMLVLPEDGMVPGSFSVHIGPVRLQTILHFRVHLVVEGKDYWSEEKAVRIVQ